MGIIIGVVLFLAVAFVVMLTVTEYRPAETEKLDILYHTGGTPQLSDAGRPLSAALGRPRTGEPLNLLTWNIGYGSLDETQDFFMDGGKNIRPASNTTVNNNLAAIAGYIAGANYDAVLLQETDTASRRSYYINQREFISDRFNGTSVFAHNFRCIFVPIPVPRFIGRVSSGLLTLNRFETTEAFRLRLPNPFTWPIRACNLKRCLLVSRIPLADSNAELILINLHLEAYDSTGGREAQTRALLDFLYAEYAKGNYCIAGGDFNQSFPGIDPERFAVKNRDYFIPGTLDPSQLAAGWRYAADTLTPTSRLLNEPYSLDSENTQLYVIDGFLFSPNVELISVQAIDLGFKNTDHNPVKIQVVLR